LGFVTAQDRLFQMELTRMIATGRLSELAGEKAEKVDIRMRTLGFSRHAERQAEILEPQTRVYFQKYIDGINAYIKNCTREHHLEFRLAGIKPGMWKISDSLAIYFFISWNSSANIETEIVAQMLVEKVGIEKAREIFPININPDDPTEGKRALIQGKTLKYVRINIFSDKEVMAFLHDSPLEIGSNNWAVGARFSLSGKPIVANDPHLDARILPGPWYPCCIITPDFRFVGVGIPGIPGFVIGRNDHIAIGVTNSYGDAQDLYIETLDPKDPERYLEGKKSIPFQIIEEAILIRDKNAPGGKREKKIRIRLTRRGPVISGVLPGLETSKVLTVRWAPFETMGPFMGFDRLMTAKSVWDVRNALSQLNTIMLNFVFADREGNIGWLASGKLPIRSRGDGTIPYMVIDSQDNWTGWIPFDRMPQLYNPERGWVGTCNHRTVGRNYPYYYSSYLSPSFRYRRLIQLLDGPGKKSVDDHWQFQRDTMNLMAKEIAPVMARALMAHDDTKEMGEILSRWDYMDDPDKAAPLIFQALYREFALLVFKDELGERLANHMLRVWYFWQERLQEMVLEGRSPWFDNIQTVDRKETMDELFHLAALKAIERLAPILGKDPKKWIWGKLHRLEFVSPIRREGFGKGLVGGGSHPFPGSGETLCRGIYEFNDPFGVTVSASLRMVADLSDDDKVLAVIPGGVAGRLFHPHTKDQIRAFIEGKKLYWWFSDKAIREHCKKVLVLRP
ncbi:MAG: penicillin acylase family protein, partial [Candidatus Bathyarchaeia archaeon]